MSDELSFTAYAVLGVLSINREMLTAGEIKQRAGYGFRHFYGSPAVSHIRRELQRLLALGLVEDREVPIGGVRRAQVFRTTEAGERRLREWVAEGGAAEPVVVKNPVLLRVFLGREIPLPDVLAIIDARLRQVDDDVRQMQRGRRRATDMGLIPHPDRAYSTAVSDYLLRSLYFERANLCQLRDTIAGFDPQPPGDDEPSTFRPAD
ncbi:PadR family transcriptional regulator [Dactylosporangium sp. CA-092794]|uniref:PadR family transcriptional regulator n=1 Tax=Dactylosporangium sp. CA-092794 TaxID=3239929 RepID=UPI003D9421F5